MYVFTLRSCLVNIQVLVPKQPKLKKRGVLGESPQLYLRSLIRIITSEDMHYINGLS